MCVSGCTMIEFEWDPIKAKANEEKHGISFQEAQTVFGDPLEFVITDPDHSEGEFRFLSLGYSKFERLLLVSYTERQANRIRIISARHASRKEKKNYESRH